MKETFQPKRLLAGILSVILVISLFPSVVFASEPDLILSTYSQFEQFASDVNNGTSYEGKTVRLDVNIDLGGADNPWTPIGSSSNPFKGTFDGNYHTVEGLYINSTGGSKLGLFGQVTGGTVKNLVVSGEVTGSSSVAGVVGSTSDATVTNCGNAATVTGSSGVGGVVGYVGGTTTVSACFNTGTVSGTTGYIGGVTGQHWRAGTVENCYNVGTVSGPATVGGVSGGHTASSPVLTNCYSAGNVIDSTGWANNIGAVLGKKRGGSITNCYYLAGTGTDANSGVTEVASITASMLSSAFVDANPYPALSWESSISQDEPVRPGFVETSVLSARLANYIKSAVNSAKSHAGVTGSFLGAPDYLAGASSTATDWMALAMGRFGYFDANGNYKFMIDDGTGYQDYLAAMKTYIENTYAANGGVLHSVKATEWQRAVVTIAALGGDPTSFGTYNGNAIDLVADGSYNCVPKRGPGGQGINGWIWGLISINTGMYTVPSDAKYSVETFITEILKMQMTDGVNGNEYGGWVLGGYGSSSDVDITAMAIQALAPYYADDTVYTYTNEVSKKEVSKTVRQCVDEALDRLGSMMNENAGFTSWNTDNAESISQVIVALCSVGIDPAQDARFITSNGKNLLDGLLVFRLSDGGFCHVATSGFNSMANDQATYALVSYWRLANGMRSLYDMRSDFTAAERQAIANAMDAIRQLPEPSSAGYKAQLKQALSVFRAVPADERQYVTNYSTLAAGIALVGGESELDTDTKYITSISVTKAPDKVRYYEGETFAPTGMIVTANYSDGSAETLTTYQLSKTGALALTDHTVYVISSILKASVSIEVVEKMPWEGNGTQDDPYRIATAEDLVALSDYVNAKKVSNDLYFAMTANIDLGELSSWTPIGSNSSRQFQGTFDGQGHTIDNLRSASGGLFGYVGVYATIQNVGVASGEIGSPNSYASFFGAIAKWSNGADFINCWNGADVYGGGYTGGIVGTIRDGGKSTISGCYNVGNIYGKSNAVGGIVGHLATTSNGTSVEVTVQNCYNTGAVSGSYSVGGIIGQAQDGHTVLNCYNTGVITSSSGSSDVGGIAGWVTGDNTITNCYFNSASAASGIGSGSGDVTAMTADEMKDASFVARLGDAFRSDKYALANAGYPILTWQATEDADAIDAAIAKIDAIGEVTLGSADAIADARAAYDALDDAQKALVSNASALTAAESSLSALLQALQEAKDAARQELAQYKNTADYRAAQQDEIAQILSEVNAQIDALTDDSGIADILSAAKARLDAVKTDRDLTDTEAAQAVYDSIAAIGEVTADKADAIAAARQAYDALSDAAKAQVGNYNVLEQAEAALRALIDQPSDGDSNTDKPTTGDPADPFVFAVVMSVSGLAVALLVLGKKKETI